MPFAALKIKIMPESPETDLEKIRAEVEKRIEEFGAKMHSVEEEPIAFGLKALIVTVAWPEEKSVEEAAENLQQISDVRSAEVIDFRRALG